MVLVHVNLIFMAISFGCVGSMPAPLASPREQGANSAEATIRQAEQQKLKILKAQFDRTIKEGERLVKQTELVCDLLEQLSLIGGVETDKNAPMAYVCSAIALRWSADTEKRLTVAL
ncbi:MAG: hypothetical protein P4L85_05125 [Paludisphaera borealis]|uniref:hypothetical protein n=1 Tax=Paludisphaera borealis TaxID=1387353 RepID=UPI00284F7EE5|nr:hypothetical protein [Paludisphaera borealis]MDR3618713.1 hypothetical protein [Paludisphaera borealis]